MSETNSRFKDAAEVSTNCRTIGAAVENPANKAFPAFSPRVECLHVCFILTGPSKDSSRFQSGANCMHVVKLRYVAKSARCVVGVQVVTHSLPSLLLTFRRVHHKMSPNGSVVDP